MEIVIIIALFVAFALGVLVGGALAPPPVSTLIKKSFHKGYTAGYKKGVDDGGHGKTGRMARS